jgi:hypothetical protein
MSASLIGPSTSAAIMSQERPMMRPVRPTGENSNEKIGKSNVQRGVSIR